MLEAHGLLQLTARSENYRSEAQLLHRSASQGSKHLTVSTDGSQTGSQSSSSSLNSGSLAGKSAVTLPKGAINGPMHDFWQQAADKAAERAPSADTLKKLQDASKSDNQDIAAQKMQQAKAKLQSLRLQAQLAAASGDKQQLRRLAQEVAAAAHDVAAAAHDLAEGVVASATDTGSTSVPQIAAGAAGQTDGDQTSGDQAASDANAAASAGAVTTATATASSSPTPVNTAATGSAAGTQPASGTSSPAPAQNADDPSATKAENDKANANKPLYAQTAPQDGDKLVWGQKALNSLATDANNAIAQARGLLAFIATAARNKRKAGEAADDDRFFNDLQHQIDDAQSQVNSDITDAHQALLSAEGGSDADLGAGTDAGDVDLSGSDVGGGSLFGIESVTVTQVTTTAIFLNITT